MDFGLNMTRRIAVVTGAGRGIGRATALALGLEGYALALIARSRSELEDTAALLLSAGAEAIVLPCDVSDEAEVRAAFDIIGAWGSLVVLVNNAGGAKFHPIAETPLEDWNRAIAVNLTGAFLCCRAAIPLNGSARQAGHRIIINIASSAGKKGYPHQGAYVAAKHGLMGLSKVLAMELREAGVRVHAICPGGVATRLAEEVHPDRDRSNWMRPEDIAEVIRFLVTRPAHLTIDEIVIRRFDSDVMF